MAAHIFRRRVHIGYLAAMVAASNAGGLGSVVGDTTTTMMWIDGMALLHVVYAYVAAVAALLMAGHLACADPSGACCLMPPRVVSSCSPERFSHP